LVALTVGAIVAASAGIALAGGVKATRGVVSTEYVASVAAASTGTARQVSLANLGNTGFTVKLNAEYALNDKITISFPCACLVDTSLPSTIQSTLGTGGQRLTFALLSSSSSAATYRVTDRVNSDSTRNLTLSFPDSITINMAAASGGVSVAFSAATSAGDAFDTSLTFNPTDTTYAASATLVTVLDQFDGDVVTPLDGVIDVNPAAGTTPLTRFTLGGTSDSVTIGTYNVTPSDVVATYPAFAQTANVSAVTYTVSGDFSWATEARKSSVFVPSCASGTASGLTLTTGSISWSCKGVNNVGNSSTASANSTLSIRVNQQTGLTALPTTTFTASSSVAYFSPNGQSGENGTTTSKTVLPAGTEAGAWTINGAQIFVPYMPYGSTIDQVIYVANKSGVAGDIAVQYIGTDTTSVVNLGKVGTINGRSTLNISPLIKAALPAAAQASGRLAFIITINAPVNDVDILASYRIGDDRAFVQTRKLN